MDPRLLQKAAQVQLISAVALALAAAFLWPAGALGVVGGGALMAANFHFLRVVITRVFTGPTGGAKAAYAVLLGAKFFAVIAALAILVLVVKVHPVGLAAGMGTLFIGIGGAVILTFVRQPAGRTPERT